MQAAPVPALAWLPPAPRRGLALAALAALVATLAGLAPAAPPAGPLADPTRPPAALQAALAASAAGIRLPRAEPAADAASAPAPLPVLQGVHLPNAGAPTAMLDGRLLKVGDTIGPRTVIGIDRQGVTLRGPGGTARVRLLGENGKQPPGSIVIGMSARFAPADAPGTAVANAARSGAEPANDAPSPNTSEPAAAAPQPGSSRP